MTTDVICGTPWIYSSAFRIGRWEKKTLTLSLRIEGIRAQRRYRRQPGTTRLP